MKEVYLISKIKSQILLNKILFTRFQNNTSTLITLFGLLFVFIGLFFSITYFGSNKIIYFFNHELKLMTSTDKSEWLSLITVLFVLSVIFNNVYITLYHFIFSKDIELLSLSGISNKTIIVGKLFERSYLKILFLSLIFISIYLNIVSIFDLSFIHGLYILLKLIFIFTITFLLRFILIIKVILDKIFKRDLLKFNLLTIFVKVTNLILILNLIYPLTKYMLNSWANKIYLVFYDSSINQLFKKLLFEFFYIWQISNTNQIVFFLNDFLILVVLVIIIYIFYQRVHSRMCEMEKFKLIELINNVKEPSKSKNSIVLKKYLGLLLYLFNLLKFIPPSIKIIILKDYKKISRNKNYRFSQTFLVLLIIYTALYVPFWLIIMKTNLINNSVIELSTMLHLSGLIIISEKLINRFSIDFEGENVILLLLSPIIAEYIAMAKILAMAGLLLPFPIVFGLITFIITKVNVVFIIIPFIAMLPTPILITLVSSSTFPNFNRASYLDLPSSRAKLMSKVLFSIYVLLVSLIVFFVKFNLMSIILWIVFSIGINVFLFVVLSKKIKFTNLRSYSSISEFID